MNSNFKVLLIGIYLSFIFASPSTLAKDMTERLGIGIKNNTAQSLPSLATVYYFTRNMAATGGFGIDTQKDYSAYQVHAGARKMIFLENNLNFYTGAQLGVISYENPIDGRSSGLEILAVIGAEFYFTGLENLAFTIEAGAAVSSSKNTRFRTVADDPFRAGIIFYF
jgi:hypothetical protein